MRTADVPLRVVALAHRVALRLRLQRRPLSALHAKVHRRCVVAVASAQIDVAVPLVLLFVAADRRSVAVVLQ